MQIINPAPPEPTLPIATEISFDPYQLKLKTTVKGGTKTLGLLDKLQKAGLETSRKDEPPLKLADLKEFALEQMLNLHAIQGTDYHRDSKCFAAKRAAMAAPRAEPKVRKKAKTTSSSARKTPVTMKNALKAFPDNALTPVEENGNIYVGCACCSYVCRSEMSKLRRHINTPTHQDALKTWKISQLKQVTLQNMIADRVDKANAESGRTSSLTAADISLQAETMKACLCSGVSDKAVFSGPIGKLIKNRTGLKLGNSNDASQ